MSFKFSKRIEILQTLGSVPNLTQDYQELFSKHLEKEVVSTGSSVGSPGSAKSCQT